MKYSIFIPGVTIILTGISSICKVNSADPTLVLNKKMVEKINVKVLERQPLDSATVSSGKSKKEQRTTEP